MGPDENEQKRLTAAAIQQAIDKIQQVHDGYRSLIRRVAMGCASCLSVITLNIVVSYYESRPWVQFILIALAVLCVIVLFKGTLLIIDILRERKRIREVIKKIYNDIPPPK